MTQGNRRPLSALLILTGLLLTAAALPERPPAKGTRARALASAATAYTCPASPSTAPGQNYRNRVLVNENFAHQNLVNADFSYAQLDGVTFVGADLTGANFSNAVFTNIYNATPRPSQPTPRPGQPPDFSLAVLRSACFIGARFDSADTPTYFNRAILSCADFSGLDLSQLNVSFGRTLNATPGTDCRTAWRGATVGCEFIAQWRLLDMNGAVIANCVGMDLKNTDFSGARFEDVDFSDARLDGANFSNAQLRGANFGYASLRGAIFAGARLGVAPGSATDGFVAANFNAAYMPNADFSHADLRLVSFTLAHVYGTASFIGALLDGADFSNAVLAGGQFSGSLSGTVFDGALLANAVFNGASLSNTKFSGAYLQGADFSRAASTSGVKLFNAVVSQTSGAWTYTEQDGSTSTYGYAATLLGTLATEKGAICPDNSDSPCTADQLTPINGGPNPPVPKCIPKPPKYDNCLPPKRP